MELALKLQETYDKSYLSYSSIKYALQDMQLFDMYMKGQLKKESDALIFGSAYDCKLFTPEKFDANFLVFDDTEKCKEIGGAKPRSTNTYKEWFAEFGQANIDKTFITIEDNTIMNDMIYRLKDTGVLDTFLMGEYQVEFNEFLDDIPVRGFLDCKSGSFISDSKSAKSVKSFRFDLKSFGYDIQAYLYTAVFGMEDFYWVAQEKTFPYTIGVYKASEDTINLGRFKFNKGVDMITDYLTNGKNPKHFYIYDTI
jgi:hypothetical protein